MYPHYRQFNGFPGTLYPYNGFPTQTPFGYQGFQPGFGQGFPGGFDQGTQGPSGSPPGPPPSYIPQTTQGIGVQAVDPGGIRGCLYRYTFIRLNNGQSFWYYPTFVGRTSVAGWRWRRGQRRWVYFGIDLRRIASYTCV